MLRLALIGRDDVHERYRRIVSRVRGVAVTAVAAVNSPQSDSSITETRAGGIDELLSDHAAVFDAVLLHSDETASERGLVSAVKAGKHILHAGSRPLSSATVRHVIEAGRDAGVRVMPGPSRRFSPAIKTVKDSLDTGRLGVPGLLRIHQWRPRGADSGAPSAALGCAPFQPLLEQLAGEIDLACWFFAGRPSAIYAVGRPADYLQLHLGFAEGGMALIDLSVALPPGDSYYSLSLLGSTGAAYADDHHNLQLLYQGGAPAALSGGAGEAEAVAQLHEFVAAINEVRDPSFSGSDLLRAIEVTEAAADVLATGHAVSATEGA